jgi:hypothetical protein
MKYLFSLLSALFKSISSREEEMSVKFVPVLESNQAQLRASLKSDAERALFEAKRLILQDQCDKARQVLIPFVDVRSEVQREIRHTLEELEDWSVSRRRPTDAPAPAAEEGSREISAVHLQFQFLAKDLVAKERCIFSWRRLAAILALQGAQAEADYIHVAIVRCLELRDRPCNAATGALRLAAEELRSIPPLRYPSEGFLALALTDSRAASDAKTSETAPREDSAGTHRSSPTEERDSPSQAAKLPFFDKYFATPVLEVFGGRRHDVIGSARFDGKSSSEGVEGKSASDATCSNPNSKET